MTHLYQTIGSGVELAVVHLRAAEPDDTSTPVGAPVTMVVTVAHSLTRTSVALNTIIIIMNIIIITVIIPW